MQRAFPDKNRFSGNQAHVNTHCVKKKMNENCQKTETLSGDISG